MNVLIESGTDGAAVQFRCSCGEILEERFPGGFICDCGARASMDDALQAARQAELAAAAVAAMLEEAS